MMLAALEIAMDDAARVGGCKAGAELPRNLQRLVLRKAADAT
jgi:hypothetical protein